MIGTGRGKITGTIAVLSLTGFFVLVSFGSHPCRCERSLCSADGSSADSLGVPEEVEREHLGRLSEIKKTGIELHLHYTGELFHGFRLIPDDSTDYRGLLELEGFLDTGKAGLWPGGELFIKAQNGHGNGLIVKPGGIPLFMSDIGATDYTQVSVYGLKQQWMDGDLKLVLGKQDANSYFSVNRFGGSFIFPAYTLIPTVPMPTFPAYALGTTLFVKPVPELSLGMGAYGGAPEIGGLGFDAFNGKGGVFSILELTWKPGSAVCDEGDYKLGTWYHSGDFAGTQPGSGSFSGNYGWYLLLNPVLFRESETGSDGQGLGGFFQVGWAPDDRNAVTKYVGAGFTYKGLVPNRDQDELGFAASYTRLVGREPAAGAKTHLTLVEVYYRVRVNSWMSLQPDVQYADNPGEDRHSGLALGVRWVINY